MAPSLSTKFRRELSDTMTMHKFFFLNQFEQSRYDVSTIDLTDFIVSFLIVGLYGITLRTTKFEWGDSNCPVR